ncbi:MAG: DUF4340 domain-containing protein [Spirochaetes bacterium]|nr:DUF4340 domain-containing protein [Spirochaetota bacterium]
MDYKKKLATLLSIIGALSVVYTATFVFAPERRGARDAVFSWIDARDRGRIESIVIENSADTVELAMRGGDWFVLHNGMEYPARAFRVDDLLDILTRRVSYPLRATSAASHARMGVSEENAFTIRVLGDIRAQPILELFVGYADMTGREVHLRRGGQNEVRSGDRLFLTFAQSSLQFWYNLRIIPETEGGWLDLDLVQRMTVYRGADAESPENGLQVFTRAGHGWVLSGTYIDDPDPTFINAYIRTVLSLEAEDFVREIAPNDPAFEHSRITLEFGDGSTRVIRLTAPDEAGRRLAAVSHWNEPAQFVHSLSAWASQRLFRDPREFERFVFTMPEPEDYAL